MKYEFNSTVEEYVTISSIFIDFYCKLIKMIFTLFCDYASLSFLTLNSITTMKTAKSRLQKVMDCIKCTLLSIISFNHFALNLLCPGLGLKNTNNIFNKA